MSTAATGAARPAPVPGARPRSLKDMLAVNFGNALEWYDWNVYTIFAPVFAAQIFHADNPTSELLATLAVFAVGFVARPIGGYVFGAYADRVGRKRSLFAAMMITALGSLIIAFTPTYGTVGVLASVILVIARLLQGLAAGMLAGVLLRFGLDVFVADGSPEQRLRGYLGQWEVAVVSDRTFAPVRGAKQQRDGDVAVLRTLLGETVVPLESGATHD